MGPKSEVCKECASWKIFGSKCWFYWDNKAECSQFKDDQMSEPKYRNTRINPEQIVQDLLEEQ
ncbi:hypothetical protein GF345_00265 [Candidatus Woesearchaeota archaeon]|nr:hypothetical protein [Candidatus Woesearchaeota archaeon]